MNDKQFLDGLRGPSPQEWADSAGFFMGMKKQAYGPMSAPCDPNQPKGWIGQFEGSPLFQQAMELERQELTMESEDLANRQADQEQYQAKAQQDQQRWNARDQIRLQKRELELQLAEQQMGAAAGAGEDLLPKHEAGTTPADVAPASGGAEPPATAPGTGMPKMASISEKALHFAIKHPSASLATTNAVTNGIMGAGIGAAIPDRGKGKRKRRALIGGAIGAGVGASAGGVLGKEIGRAAKAHQTANRRLKISDPGEWFSSLKKAKNGIKEAGLHPIAKASLIGAGIGAGVGGLGGAVNAREGKSTKREALRGAYNSAITGALLGAGIGSIKHIAPPGDAISRAWPKPRGGGHFKNAMKKLGFEIKPSDRSDIPKKDFAQPNKEEEGHKGKYPIPDRQHARSALGFAKMHGDSGAEAAVKAKVEKKFPDMLGKEASLNEMRDAVRLAMGPRQPTSALQKALTIGFAAGAGALSFNKNRGRKNLGGRSKAEVGAEKELETQKNDGMDESHLGLSGKLNRRVTEAGPGIAKAMREHPVLSTAGGAALGATLAGPVSRALGVGADALKHYRALKG